MIWITKIFRLSFEVTDDIRILSSDSCVYNNISVDVQCMTLKYCVSTSDLSCCVTQEMKWCGFGTTCVNGDSIFICMWFNSLCGAGAVWLTFAFIWPIYFAFSGKHNAVIFPNFIIWKEKLNKMAFSLFRVCVWRILLPHPNSNLIRIKSKKSLEPQDIVCPT